MKLDGSGIKLERIFEGGDIAVDANAGTGTDALITFTSYEKSGGANRGAFSGAVERLGRPSVLFISKWNHWFNSHELPKAIEAVNKFLKPYSNRTLIGPSMGGHTAIRLATRLEATAVVAISPQFCIRSTLVPFETRWRKEANNISDWDQGIHNTQYNALTYVIFDSEDEADSKHTQLISESVPTTLIGLPYSGHSSAQALADLGLLSLLFRFDASEENNQKLVTAIEKKYLIHGGNSASVLLNKLKTLNLPEQREMVESVSDDIIGISKSRENLKNFLSNRQLSIERL